MRGREFSYFSAARHLLPVLLATSSSNASGSKSVTWASPSAGDVYVTGDTIVGSWNTTSNVTNPSFQLCNGSDGENATYSSTSSTGDVSCGTSVWPAIAQSGSLSSVQLAVPNVTFAGTYYLIMKGDSGDASNSPSFSLSPQQSFDTASVSPSSTNTFSDDWPTSNASSTPSSNKIPASAVAVPLSLCGALVLTALLLIFRKKHSKVPNSQLGPITYLSLPMAKSFSQSMVSDEKKQGCNHQQPAPAYIPPAFASLKRNPSDGGMEDLNRHRDWVYADPHGKEKDIRQDRDSYYWRNGKSLLRHHSWRDWVFRRELSMRRRDLEFEREHELERELYRRRHREEREREREREMQMEMQWWEDREREKRRRMEGRWTPLSRSGASRRSDRSFDEDSKLTGSATRVNRSSSPYSVRQESNYPSMDRYSRSSSYVQAPPAASRPRSRAQSYASHYDTVEERRMLPQSQPPQDVYAAVDRVVGRTPVPY